MTSAPLLFDHAILTRRAGRMLDAQGQNDSGADFLMRRAAEDLAERLQTVLRSFPDVLDFATPTAAFHDVLKLFRPTAQVSRILPFFDEQERLPLGNAHYDLIASGLALQHLNDLPGALIQLRRALKPDGLFMGCLCGGATLTELRQVLTQAESEVTGGVSPRIFPFADVRDMGGLLQRAGFALPVADSEIVTVRYADIFALMADLRAMGGANILHARLKRFTPRRVMVRAAEIYAQRFADADGRLRATFELVWLSGWAPHESQQKPLKPGSAKQRLADALKVPERKIEE